jgi:uncharacterized membrane protein YeaQ/YmgE (transglycosylase-associated protein family)
MGILSWILFGAIAGWVASLLTGRNRRMGCLGNIIIGILGAMLGGFVVELFGGRGNITGFNWPSFGVAVLGAVILLGVTGWYAQQEKK